MPLTLHTRSLSIAPIILAFMLSACGGGGSGTPAPTSASYTVGGTISGLVGTVILQNNSGNDLTIATNGNFAFTTPLASASTYNVTVKTQPTTPSQICSVTNGNGTVTNSNVTNVVVTCSLNRYTISYSVSGLEGSGLVVQNNAADDAAIDAGGNYSFATSIASGQNYKLSVLKQPSNPIQSCKVTSGSGTVTNANITVPTISCGTIYPRFAYAASSYYNNVSVYSVDPATGALTSTGSTIAAGTGPSSITVDPSGKFAYVANGDSNNISAYTINASTGALTTVTGSPFAAGTNPRSITIDPSGNFVYAANFYSGNISAYSIDPATGALTAMSGSPVPATLSTRSITVEPSGKFAYVAEYYSNSVMAYAINAATGVLTLATGSLSPTGIGPYPVAADPSGKFVYVPNLLDDSVSAYMINHSTGALTAVTGSPFAAGVFPSSVTVDPSGKFVYVRNGGANGGISAYMINASTGALTAVTGSPFPASGILAAGTITVDPSGKFVYVIDRGISAYAINSSTGALTAVTGSPFAVSASAFVVLGTIQ